MLDLQAVVQRLGVKGRGKHWVVVTSQEKLGELVSGLDDKKIELGTRFCSALAVAVFPELIAPFSQMTVGVPAFIMGHAFNDYCAES
jgi:hypothetical protein